MVIFGKLAKLPLCYTRHVLYHPRPSTSPITIRLLPLPFLTYELRPTSRIEVRGRGESESNDEMIPERAIGVGFGCRIARLSNRSGCVRAWQA